MTLATYAVVYVVLATTGLVLLRRALADGDLAELLRDPAFLLGAVCYACSFGTFLLSLRRFDVLVVYPLFTGLAFATVTLAAWRVLGEPLTMARLGGIVLISTGAVLLVR